MVNDEKVYGIQDPMASAKEPKKLQDPLIPKKPPEKKPESPQQFIIYRILGRLRPTDLRTIQSVMDEFNPHMSTMPYRFRDMLVYKGYLTHGRELTFEGAVWVQGVVREHENDLATAWERSFDDESGNDPGE